MTRTIGDCTYFRIRTSAHKLGHLYHLILPWAYDAALAGSIADFVQSLMFDFRLEDTHYNDQYILKPG